MTGQAILAIDQGTTNTKALLIDHGGQIVAIGSAPLAISHPRPGWTEQSAQLIWQSVLNAVKACVAKSPGTTIAAIGISNQRETVVCWDATSGEPLAPALTWQCRRTADTTERLKADGHQDRILAKTGLPLDPLFPASKIRWLMDHTPAGNRCVGTVDSWLIWKLSAGQCFATDRSNASRTQLLDVQKGDWDAELCELFGVDARLLPQVADSSNLFGQTHGVAGIPDGTPIAAAIGDSHAALFGHAAFEPGDAKATFGTGSSVMMVQPQFSVPGNGMTTTIAWSINGQISYALEGNILVSASLFPWAADMLGLQGDVDQLMELATSVPDANGAWLVPALAGLGAPHWTPHARGTISGLSFASTPAHIAHAAAVSLPLQACDVFDAMRQQSAMPHKTGDRGQIFVDGQPTRNRFLMQYLAGLLNQDVIVCRDPELSALGAGMLAGLRVGFWANLQDIATLQRNRDTIEPAMSDSERNTILHGWRDAVRHCMSSVGSRPA